MADYNREWKRDDDDDDDQEIDETVRHLVASDKISANRATKELQGAERCCASSHRGQRVNACTSSCFRLQEGRSR